MTVTSKFTKRIINVLVLFPVMLFIVAIVVYTIVTNPGSVPVVAYVFLILFLAAIVLLFVSEFYKKMIRVEIDEHTITVNRILGWGKDEVHYFSSFDGYTTTVLPNEYNSYEYLYLLREGKKVIKISEFYHANYKELKAVVSRRAKNKGVLPYSFMREMREVFR